MGSRSTVLIVETATAPRLELVEIVLRAGYEPLPTRSFADGRKALRECYPALMITDVRLGEYSWLQLVLTSPVEIPTILIADFADPVHAMEAQRLGADYLVRPVAPFTLFQSIERKLGGVRAREQSPRDIT